MRRDFCIFSHIIWPVALKSQGQVLVSLFACPQRLELWVSVHLHTNVCGSDVRESHGSVDFDRQMGASVDQLNVVFLYMYVRL